MPHAILNKYRERLYIALLGDVEVLGNSVARAMLENIARLDLEAIEPILEEMIAEIEGRLGRRH